MVAHCGTETAPEYDKSGGRQRGRLNVCVSAGGVNRHYTRARKGFSRFIIQLAVSD